MPAVVRLEPRCVPAAIGGLYVGGGRIGGVPHTVTGAGYGGGPQVKVFRSTDNALRLNFFTYDPTFRGGVAVAVGDINGDGNADIVTAPGPGGGPHVKAFSGLDGSLLWQTLAYDGGFRGGLNVAAGDFTGDGRADVVTAPGPGGGPHVKVFDGVTGRVVWEAVAYDAAFRGGVTVAAGDVDADGKADVVTAPGPGGGPHVKAFAGATRVAVRSFMAYDPGFRGGVSIAAGDVNGDGRADIVTAPGFGGPSSVRAFDGALNGTADLRGFTAYDRSFTGGVNVAVFDATGDGVGEIVTTTASGAFDQQPTEFATRGSLPQASSLGHGELYRPSGLVDGQTYPLVVAFAPDGSGAAMIDLWRANAEHNRWIVYASNEYRNGPDTAEVSVLNHILDVVRGQPVNASRVVYTGFSGGGSMAQHLAIRYDSTLRPAALIVNCAMIWDGVNGPTDKPTVQANQEVFRTAFAGMQAVFLASPAGPPGYGGDGVYYPDGRDFRLDEMQSDYALYGRLGVRTEWLEFYGGHRLAPPAAYFEAARRVRVNGGW